MDIHGFADPKEEMTGEKKNHCSGAFPFFPPMEIPWSWNIKLFLHFPLPEDAVPEARIFLCHRYL